MILYKSSLPGGISGPQTWRTKRVIPGEFATGSCGYTPCRQNCQLQHWTNFANRCHRLAAESGCNQLYDASLNISGFSHIIRFYTLLGLLCHVQQGHWKTEGTYHASYRTKPHDLILSSQRWARHTNLWHSTDCICVLQWLSWMGSLHGHCVHLPAAVF